MKNFRLCENEQNSTRTFTSRFSSEHMAQTIISQQHLNDAIPLPVPRGLKTGKLNRYKKNVL